MFWEFALKSSWQKERKKERKNAAAYLLTNYRCRSAFFSRPERWIAIMIKKYKRETNKKGRLRWY